jgi:hypothetical protein
VERFTGRKLDFQRDVRAGFGDYVQIKTNPRQMNSSEARTRGCIVLMPLSNISGTFRMYSVDKGTIIDADNWTALPTPDVVIDKMNQWAIQDHKTPRAKLIKEVRNATPEDQTVMPREWEELVNAHREKLASILEGTPTHLPVDPPMATDPSENERDMEFPVAENNTVGSEDVLVPGTVREAEHTPTEEKGNDVT